MLIPHLAYPQNTDTQEPPQEKLELKTDFMPQVLAYNNTEGVWFNTIDAQYLLYMRRDLVPSLLRLDSQNVQIVSGLKNQISLLNKVGDLQDGKVQLVKDQLSDVNKQLAECRDEQSSFIRNPVFIIAVGFLIGVVTTVGIIAATK